MIRGIYLSGVVIESIVNKCVNNKILLVYTTLVPSVCANHVEREISEFSTIVEL